MPRRRGGPGKPVLLHTVDLLVIKKLKQEMRTMKQEMAFMSLKQEETKADLRDKKLT